MRTSPPPPPPGGVPVRCALAAVCAAALGVRLVYLWQASSLPNFRVPYAGLDAALYDQLARQVAAGDWLLGTEVFHYSPLFAYFLGCVYALLGSGPWPVRLVNVALGTGTVALVFLFSRRWFGDLRVAVLAAFGLAFYGPVVVFDTSALKTSFGLFLVAGALWLTARSQNEMRPAPWLAVGVIWGMALNLAGQVGCVILALAAWLLLRRVAGEAPPLGARMAPACALLAGAVLSVAPFTARNLWVAGDFVPLTSTQGIHQYAANHKGSWGGYSPVPGVRPSPAGHHFDARREAERALGRKLKASQVSAYWQGLARKNVRADPVGFLRLVKRRLQLIISPEEIPNNENYRYLRQRSWLLRGLLDARVLLPLGIVGLALGLIGMPRVRPLVLFFAGYALTLTVSLVNGRYRLPLVLALWPFAAHLGVQAWIWVRARRRLPVVLAVAGIALVVRAGAWGDPGGNHATRLRRAQVRMEDCTREQRLIEELAGCVECADDRVAELYLRLSNLHRRQQDYEGGEAILQEGTARLPGRGDLITALQDLKRKRDGS